MAGATIDLLLIGVSHKTAPVAVRERLAVEPDAIAAALAELTALSAVREAAMISTCNRVELYVAADDADRAATDLGHVLARRAGVAVADLAEHLYQHRDSAAVRHLFRVASSLDSLVIGEPQILGQTKQAYDDAVQHGTAGVVLRACFEEGAFRVARRVRRETAIARNPVSVSSVAVDFARQVVGDFSRKRVLIVGAGKMSELAARTLRTHGATLTVVNRTRARAEELASRFGADVADWNDLHGALGAADIVIASTGAQRPVLTFDLLKQVRKQRRGRPLCLLDIAVPRDVEPTASELDGIYLFDIDDLQKQASEHRAEREEEAAEAEAVVEEELGRFVKRWRSRQRGPVVSALQTHFHGIARAEVMRLSGGVDEKERKARLDMAESLVKKLLHLPMTALRDDDPDEAVSLVQALQRLFSLSPVAAVPASDEAPAGREGAVDKKAAGS
ncbi:MAG TPA: glutamyl-tRNA reductase [Polyangia bacterium]|jgi:glutamyl-tRNA reductase|nr:glutamyl-tRNA reductase [Polyangia bacterium]